MAVTLDPALLATLGRDTGIASVVFTRWGWAAAESLHFIGIVLLFGAVGVVDLRMLGLARAMPLRSLHRLVPVGIAGFALCAVTGFSFVVTMPDQYLYNPALQTKLALVLAAGVNMVAFYATSRGALDAASGSLPAWRARAFAIVSLACWTGAIACGRVITAFRPPYHWCAWC